MTGWTAIQRNVDINYDLENSPLQIRTDSPVESYDYMVVYFYTAQRIWTGGVQIYLSPSPKYYPRFCTSSWTKFPTALPNETNKIWTITLSKTSGIRFIIHCNNKEVLNVMMSDTTCTDSNWSEKWSSDVEKIQFSSSDEASDYYRPGKVHITFILTVMCNVSFDKSW